MNTRRPITILIADDDKDDQMLLKEAFQESRLNNTLHFVENGEELMDYLNKSPLPGLILLDLNMPKKDGRETLREIKSNSKFKQIPVIVLTTSKAEADIYKTYNLGVNSFITKPVTFEALVEVTKQLTKYWLEIVELPLSH